MGKIQKKDWNAEVEAQLERWLSGEVSSYFDIRSYLCSFDLGLLFLVRGKFRLFFNKWVSLGRPRIPVTFSDQQPPRSENSSAIVVTYNPDEQVVANLKQLCSQFSCVIIVDNTPSGAAKLIWESEFFKASEKIFLFANGNRNGLAGAINQGIREVFRRQTAGWVFWFDQDTEISPNFVTRLTEIIQSLPHSLSQNALFGLNYDDGKTVPRTSKHLIEKHATVITSGSFTRVENLKRLGLYVDELFIDSLDHEYCLRAQRFGMGVYWIAEPLMRHSLGRIELRSLLWKKDVIITNHPPFRWYFFSRNLIFTWVDGLPWSLTWGLSHGFSLVKNFIKMILLEQDQTKKAKQFLLGIWDGIFLVLGRR